MPRNFMEERQAQLVAERLEKTLDLIFVDPRIIALYRQNPLLNLLLKNAGKANKKSPYTRPINADH